MREIMRKKHDGKKNVVVFTEGEFATLAITGSDRASLDMRRILVKIVDVPKFNIYQLQCEHGILERKVTASSLNTVPEAVARRYHNLFLNAPTKTLTLSTAAKKGSNIERIGIYCNCRTGCTTNRCTCHKNNEQYTQYCHPFEYDCGNMAERIINRTEKPIVNCRKRSENTAAASRRKRTATVTSPNQRRHKIAKTTQPSASNTGSASGEPSVKTTAR